MFVHNDRLSCIQFDGQHLAGKICSESHQPRRTCGIEINYEG